MKIVSFNVNSVRMRLHQLQSLVQEHNPDIIGLQETKVIDDEFPVDNIAALGYEAIFTGQKTHYGVAILVRKGLAFQTLCKQFPGAGDDAQKRIIGIRLEQNPTPLFILNGYFPQGESRHHPIKFPAKAQFYNDLTAYLERNFRPTDAVIVMGDMNISHTDYDIGIGEDNRKRWLRDGKCSFLPEERAWLDRLCDWGLFDTYRHQHPADNAHFSWFDYRSKGFEREPKRGLRIDLILATAPLMQQLQSTGISYSVRALDKPSDHCPVWAEFKLA
jgi:exodeoxyribonuclease III